MQIEVHKTVAAIAVPSMSTASLTAAFNSPGLRAANP
jgi:hypothetical protein